MTSTETSEGIANELRSWLADEWSSDSLRAVDVTYRFGVDNQGERALFLVVTIPVPDGLETWPKDEMLELRRAVRNRIAHGSLPESVYLELRPAVDEPQQGDEADEPPAVTG